ncbi:DUF4365 domain-containing protein [Aquimarina sp. 433]
MNKLPKRDRNKVLERNSVLFFDNCIPNNWTTYKPIEDYGVDLIVNIFEDEHPLYDFEVQLKSSENSINGEFEKARLKVSTYNYLKNRLHIVMLVKYCEEENEAYWTLLCDIIQPNQSQKTFTVSIPKKNKLSNLDWNSVKAYIKDIVDYKLTIDDEIRIKIRQKNII